MSPIGNIQVVIFSLLMMISGSLYAGNQGVSSYIGVGLGGSSVSDSDLDIAPTAIFFAGIEEDGWAVEYAVFQSTETGSDDPTVDYTLTGSQGGLSYRTIEEGGIYYKIRFANSDVDVDYKDNILPAITTSGKIWGLSIGFRMGRTERLEIEYGLYTPDEDTFNNTHMLMFNYLFGGPTTGRK